VKPKRIASETRIAASLCTASLTLPETGCIHQLPLNLLLRAHPLGTLLHERKLLSLVVVLRVIHQIPTKAALFLGPPAFLALAPAPEFRFRLVQVKKAVSVAFVVHTIGKGQTDLIVLDPIVFVGTGNGIYGSFDASAIVVAHFAVTIHFPLTLCRQRHTVKAEFLVV
jgi:hypothetical protein